MLTSGWLIKFGDNSRYEVGYYDPKGDWIKLTSFSCITKAMDQIHYLNGGNHHYLNGEGKK